MPPTLVDIAKRTNTSVSTVSRVLAGGAVAQRISAETRARVTAAAKAMGYRPNLLARGLRTRKSNTIALLVTDFANPWYGQIASLVEEGLHRHGYSMMLCNSGEDPVREAEYLQMLPQKGIDGMILVPLVRTRRALHEFIPPDLPLVILDRPISGISASVSSDEEQLAGILCDTLLRASVREVALVTGPSTIVTHRRRGEIVSRGFHVVARHEGPARIETGRQAFIKFGEGRHALPDAIVCTNNFLGQGVIETIAQIERPPIIACFDEIPMMHLLPLPIVCSIQDIPMLADAAVNLLLPQLTGESPRLQPVIVPARAVTNRAFQTRQSIRA